MATKDSRMAGGFAVCGALYIIIFMVVVNVLTSPSYPWAIYPAFAAVWWPLSVILPRRFGSEFFALAGSTLSSLFLIAVNCVSSPAYPWVLFALPIPVLWPVFQCFGGRAAKLSFALPVSLLLFLYYAALNVTIAKGFPWCMFILYAAAWWPLSIFFAHRGHGFGLSVAGAVITSVLFFALNRITTPNQIWFIYPVFAVLWWPLSVYFFSFRRARA
ncbi:MAG TPA: hypothetical protein VHR42_10720 [Clostridia bacterium]|nr:hypothetical protein [Clostridia bacterium]